MEGKYQMSITEHIWKERQSAADLPRVVTTDTLRPVLISRLSAV